MTRSIQQLPNNTTTAQTEAVYTATGFTAGDAVYYQNGDYVSPTVTPSAFANPTGSLTFTPTQTGPICSSSGTDANMGGVSPVLTGPTTGYEYKGGTRGKSTAVLTNGNVVNVWMQQATMTAAGRPFFQITTPDGAIVVATTQISTTFYTTVVATVCVTALTGGGFVVAWQVTNGGTALKPCFAIYTNTGTVTTAVTQETSVTTLPNNTAVNVTALTNGGFVMVVKASASNTVQHRGFSSTGVAAYAWTAAFTTGASTSPLGVASRSDNGGEFIIIDWGSTSTMNWRVLSYAGATVISGTISPTVAITSSQYNVDATTLTNGKFVVGYSGRSNTGVGNSFGGFNLIDTAYGVEAEVNISLNNQNQANGSSPCTKATEVHALSTGGFIYAFLDGTMCINYAFFNSAGVVESQSNIYGAKPYQILNTFINNYWQMSIIETSGFVRIYWSPSTSSTGALATANIFTTKISMSTYLVTYANSFTANVAPASTSAASTVNVANSTLTNVKYNLVSNLTSTLGDSIPAVLPASATIALGCDGVHSATLTSGQLAVAYQVGGIDRVRVNIYSVDLVLQQTIEVAQSFDSGYLCRIIALSGGGFVVGYGAGSGTVTFVVYNSSFTEVYRTTSATMSALDSVQNYAMAALTENKYVVVFANNPSGTTELFVYSGSSNTTLDNFNPTTASSRGPWASTTAFIQIMGNNYGGFLITAKGTSTSTSFAACYLQSGANTWTYAGASTLTQTTGTMYQQQGIAYSGAGMYLLFTTPSTATDQHNINSFADGFITGNSFISSLVTISNNATSFENAIGVTGNGTFVVTTLGSTLNRIYGMPAAGSLSNAGTDGTATAFVTYPGDGRVVVTTSNADVSNNFVTVSPTIANRAFIVRRNTSSQPVISTICAYPAVVTTFVPNTQVSSTAAVSINPQLNNTSTTISGTILTGVAATTASAGSTGLIINNGLAQLNSSYPAVSAQNVDTTGFAVAGVKGILKNRVINMQGNT